MKNYTYSLLAAALACGVAQAAATAYTTPVGYVSLGNAASPAIPAEADALISIPLDRASVYTGVVSSVNTGTNVITLAGTSPLGVVDYTTVPHIAKIGSGAKSGLIALITLNTDSTITVSSMSGESLSGIVAGDKVEIQLAWTVKSLFEGTTVPPGTQLLAFSGTSVGTNLAPDITYEYESVATGEWADLSDYSNADNKVLFPGEAFVVRTLAGGSISSLVVTGTVPTSNSRVIIENPDDSVGQDNFASYVSPISTTVGAMGFNAQPGDQILLLDVPGDPLIAAQNKGAAVTLEYGSVNPGEWANLADYSNADGFVIPAGQGLIYRVVVGAPTGSNPWSSTPSYVPSL